MNEEFLLPREVAKLRRKTVGSLAVERCQRRGPEYVKDNRRVLYRRSSLMKWMEERTVRSTAFDGREER